MNDICIDIDYQQLYKHGQKIGGDVFLLDREKGNNVITATLSDGLGSGVKANVLASLTSHMANKLSFSPIDLNHSAEIIMDTLPIDKDKGISYATFTIARIVYASDKSFINVSLSEYDNPESLRFSGDKPVEWKRAANKLDRKAAVKEEIVYSSSFSMEDGDRLIYYSDGVVQAGIDLGRTDSSLAQKYNANHAGLMGQASASKVQNIAALIGQPIQKNQTLKESGVLSNRLGGLNTNASSEWGQETIRDFISAIIRRQPDIPSRDLAREIVTEAYKRDDYKPNDDITCVCVHVRKPRRTLIITGAPRSRESDKQLRSIIENYDGHVIVCGGTTAKIVARELGRELKADKSPSGNLPPSSIIDGIDLVTEGMLVLGAVSERLSKKTLLKHMPEDAAKRFIKIIRETDQVNFVVGTKINEETSDPRMAAEIGVRLPLIDAIVRALEENYLKEVEVRYL